MPWYSVACVVDLEEQNPYSAALAGLTIIKDPNETVRTFIVQDKDGEEVTVILEDKTR